jgi:allantoicase
VLAGLVDLASERLGGRAVFANDEFFAPKENLCADTEPVWRPDEYTDRGKWMDGWETRRRREPGHDFCIVRLGLPGVVRGVVVDTSHFKGNFPESCALFGAAPGGDPAADDVRWTPLVAQSPLAGDAKNAFEVSCPFRFTHVRLDIHPDGGVARLRVLGEVVADLRRSPEDAELDLASLAVGGRVLETSDSFFGSHHKLLLPDAPRGMHDGWETRRRRGPGHDWAKVALGVRGTIGRVTIDTTHFKGNAPGSAALEVSESPDGPWTEVLPRTPLSPDRVHEIALAEARLATHARLAIHPDGGVARLRLWGTVTRLDRVRQSVRLLDVLVPDDARRVFLSACGSRAFADRMADARPFGGWDALAAAAKKVWRALAGEDWLEAFAAHPRIGEGSSDASSRTEQSAVLGASGAVLSALADANRAYEARFGHVYLVCASGRGAEELLADCRARFGNDAEKELRIAAEEQEKITERRLERWALG